MALLQVRDAVIEVTIEMCDNFEFPSTSEIPCHGEVNFVKTPTNDRFAGENKDLSPEANTTTFKDGKLIRVGQGYTW